MEQEGHRNVPPAKAATFIEREEDRGYASGLGREQGRCCRGTQQGK